MGSPLGHALANASLCHYGKEWLDNCPSHFKPIMHRRFVDNILFLFASNEHLQSFVDYINKQHRCKNLHLKLSKITPFLFLTLIQPVKIPYLKELFIKNLLSIVFLHTMKVTLINVTRGH